MSYRVYIWHERDRYSVSLYDDFDRCVCEWWDETVDELINDGFFNPRNLQQSVIDYAHHIGAIPGPNLFHYFVKHTR